MDGRARTTYQRPEHPYTGKSTGGRSETRHRTALRVGDFDPVNARATHSRLEDRLITKEHRKGFFTLATQEAAVDGAFEYGIFRCWHHPLLP